MTNTDHRRQTFFWIAVAVLLAGILYVLRGTLTPFIAASILAYALAPAVARLQHWRVPRAIAAALSHHTDSPHVQVVADPAVQRGGADRLAIHPNEREPTPEGAGSPLAHEGERVAQTAMMPSFTKKYTTNAATETQKRGFTSLAFPDVTFKMA